MTSRDRPQSKAVAFTINLRNPMNGWIEVEFHLDEQDFRFVASNVGNDPVRDLAEFALFIVRGAPWRSHVTFWLEPEGYELRASRDPELKLVVSYSNTAYVTLFDPEVLLERAVDGMSVAAEIMRCLLAARPMFAAATVAAAALGAQAWYREFPEDLLLQLEQALT